MAEIQPVKYAEPVASIPALPLKAQVITKSDSTTYSEPITLEVQTAGDLVVMPFYGAFDGTETAITIPAAVAVAGYRPPFRVKQVLSTGTTATVIGIF